MVAGGGDVVPDGVFVGTVVVVVVVVVSDVADGAATVVPWLVVVVLVPVVCVAVPETPPALLTLAPVVLPETAGAAVGCVAIPIAVPLTTSSTRRFCWRPRGVVLDAIG